LYIWRKEKRINRGNKKRNCTENNVRGRRAVLTAAELRDVHRL